MLRVKKGFDKILFCQDLLLNLNYANIMEVPKLCQILIIPKVALYIIKKCKISNGDCFFSKIQIA